MKTAEEFIHEFQDKFRENGGGVVKQLMQEYAKQLLEEYTNRIVENAKVIENRSLSGMRVGSFSIDKESITSQLEIFKKEMGL